VDESGSGLRPMTRLGVSGVDRMGPITTPRFRSDTEEEN
jgi:hypothetical protein